MSSGCKTTRLWIPHTFVPDCKIAGDLEQVEPSEPTHGRKVALILHGTMGHKDYLFQKRLAKVLPIDSFRFDFRRVMNTLGFWSNHETGGVWKMSALDEDLEDLQVVTQHLSETFGYIINLIIGHSRGSVVAMRWLCTTEGKRVRGFVNVSGRYRMEVDRAGIYKPYFESQGYYDWKVTVARKPVIGRIYPRDLDIFASWDSSLVRDRFSPNTHVLTLHGLKDETVPPYDALIYARVLGTRSPGTHNLHIIEEANHNFSAHQVEVVETILHWWSLLERGGLQTGVLNTDFIKGRL
ncbi:ectomycorrhiza-regulated esterase [Phellopilus nigrolimitatus]|nr:ectomycorrhiza-regulated esterase [Phellopilus nigrolimitatus]